ncbi:D-alanyl-D-alanine carboxypeptidase [Paenibacillus sp. sptzw28]|uniref:D-alanyl-D-alanine carboxypeptidase family protein n=1 Tax=Paenibacillus sp. sptzw28 TaxID=715179 RepID=UPI001C6E25CE|nr:D-alanyl-D-alanine carboxypeptidase family protein [Paenibacillus sp. sptzw28]QYR19952.1 D-alanyl-D-alanine carboxypeptidase [Paenibacillus sp. sptzw28]
MRLVRYLITLSGVFALSFLPGILPAANAAAPEPITTHARAAALIDVESGRLLYSSAGDKPMKIASLTKIMTAIVAIEHGKLSDMVKTSKRAAGKEGSSIYLKLGEEMSLQNMLYGLMLRSGNDAATAIAEHVGGSEEGFVHMMNEKARMLGLANTQFMNPSGLDDQGHYSSADDMAKLTAYALKNPVFKEIVKTKVKTAPNPYDEWDYKWRNKNKMLTMYEGADGVKTGYTTQAFRCLVSSATRGGQQLAVVTLNDGDDWLDHRKLLDWGFANYPLSEVVHKGQPVNGFALAVGRTFRYPFAEGERQQLRSNLVLLSERSTAYSLGERGTIEWSIGDMKIGSTPVYEPQGARINLPERAASASPDASPVTVKTAMHSFLSALRLTLSALFGGKEAGGW